MRMIRALALVFLVISIVSFNGEAGGIDEGILVGEPEITIDVSPDEQTADVCPAGETCGVVIFTGEVTAHVPLSTRFQYLMVYLTYDAPGWATSGTPQVIFTRTQETMPFSCSVQVPPMTSSSVIGTLTVSGQWAYDKGPGGGSIPPDTATIFISPYSAPDIGLRKTNLSGAFGEYIECEFTLSNDGNCDDEFEVSIIAQDGCDLSSKDEGKVSIAEHGSRVLKFDVAQVSGSPGQREITVTAIGSHAGGLATVSKVIVLHTSLRPTVHKAIPWGIGTGAVMMVLALVAVLFVRFGLPRMRERKRARATS